MIGSEVGLYLNMVRGALYKKFPSLWRCVASPDERKHIIGLVPHNSHALSSCITLLKASEVMEIIKGIGDRYKRTSVQNILKETSTFINKDDIEDNNEIKRIIDLPIIEATFKPTPAAIYDVKNKRVRTFPLFFPPTSNNINEEIIPIVLDIASEKMRLRDCFTWNIWGLLKLSNFLDTDISIEAYAELLCDDLAFPSEYFAPKIISSMNDQISTHKQLLEVFSRKYNEREKRVVIKLDIYVGEIRLQDQFEWDILDSTNSPEQFAVSLVNELGLSLEFIPRIIVDIRCQLNWYKSMYSQQDQQYLPPISFPGLRNPEYLDSWTPSITKNTYNPR
ncbi:hypothetical protein HZS_5160 [Henneguya salminicola]|nr:hypothetical protein HZS_5160 [Henneguya salminicola]